MCKRRIGTPEVTRPATGQWVRLRLDAFTMLLVAFSALGVALVMASQIAYGVRVTPDSVEYIAMARNLAAGEGFADKSGSPIATWPPLYPLLLAAASLGTLDPIDVAGPVNAAVFGLTIFMVGRYLRQRLVSRLLAVWGCLAVTLSIPLVDLASQAMTGPLFILLATLALVRIDKFLADGKTSCLVQAAVFSALAWQTRNIGVALPLLASLLFLFQPGAPLMQKTRRIVVFSLIAGIPMALWIVGSYLLLGDRPDPHRLPGFFLPAILRDVLDVLWGHWLYFYYPLERWPSLELLPAASALLLLAGLLSAPIGCMFARVRHKRHIALLTGTHCVFGGFAVVYFVLLVTGIMLGFAQSLGARYLAPLYVPLLVSAVVMLDRLLVHDRQRRLWGGTGRLPMAASGAQGSAEARSPQSIILMTVLFLWTLGQVPPNVDRIIRTNTTGDGLWLGFNGPRYAESEVLRYIRENPIDGPVYSTRPRVVYLHNSGNGIYRSLPVSNPAGYSIDDWYLGLGTGREQLTQWLAYAYVPDGAYVVWFRYRYNYRRYDYSAADMYWLEDFEPVAEMADGAIFKVNRNGTSGTNSFLSAYESIASGNSGEPEATSTFDVRLEGTTLIYLKEPCVAEDLAAKFFLHVVPRNEADLSAFSRRHRSSFNNLDFTFPQNGAMWDGRCLILATLPDYEITRIRTGQYIRGEGKLWEARIPVVE